MLGSSIIHIIPQACLANSVQGTNTGNEIGQSLTVFHEPRRRMTPIKE